MARDSLLVVCQKSPERLSEEGTVRPQFPSRKPGTERRLGNAACQSSSGVALWGWFSATGTGKPFKTESAQDLGNIVCKLMRKKNESILTRV